MNLSFSVIIPTHNRPDLLREALASVLAQTRLPHEILIVDDASSPPVSATDFDGLSDIQIRVLRHPKPLGGAAAKNTRTRSARRSAGVSG